MVGAGIPRMANNLLVVAIMGGVFYLIIKSFITGEPVKIDMSKFFGKNK